MIDADAFTDDASPANRALPSPRHERPALERPPPPHATGSEARSGRPVVLLLHGGGWLLPDEDRSAEEARAAREAGLEPRYVDYTNGDLAQAWRDVRDAAKALRTRRRLTFAWGFSSGGNMASMLAVKGLIDGAAAVAPPNNLVTWKPGDWPYVRNDGPGTRRFMSPVFSRSRVPLNIFHSRDDPETPFLANRLWAGRDRKVRLTPVAGTHRWDREAILRYTARSMGWLRGLARARTVLTAGPPRHGPR